MPRSAAARNLFDGMPRGEEDKRARPASGVDHIGALPDEVLHHLLSLMPVQAAVRTCVLAQRWRHLWRSTTGLRVMGIEGPGTVKELHKFMYHLLILRERTDLDSVEIKFDEFSEDDVPYVNLWARFAVLCKVRALTVHIYAHESLFLDDLPLVSRHLRTLDLDGVGLRGTVLEFSNYSALEDLRISVCTIHVHKISSQSLKHLSIADGHSDLDCRVRVHAPRLVTLKLDDFSAKTPLFESMPLLETASLKRGRPRDDLCYSDFCGAHDNACENCRFYNEGSSDFVLFDAIKTAKHLELLSLFGMINFTKGLKQCQFPTFGNLKTLLLNAYWCMAPDLYALTCILKYSPVLEKLTLELVSEEENATIEIKGRCSSVERSSAISEHLKIVDVKCVSVNERVLKVLKFLSTLNIEFSFV